MVVQPDIEDPEFALASPDAMFVDPRTEALDALTELIPNLYRHTEETQTCGNAALTAAVAMMRERGGIVRFGNGM